MRHLRLSAYAFICLTLQALAAQTPTATAPPPTINKGVPVQITESHTVFLANLGADPNFPIDSTRAFDDVRAALETWGHYQLVDSPDKAQLVFNLREAAPISSVNGIQGNVASYTSPAFELTIVEPRSNTALWTVSSPVIISGGKKDFDHWVTLSESNLISRIQVLAGGNLTTSQTAALTTRPRTHEHSLRTGLIIAGSLVAAGIAGGFILHHEFENSLADQKAQQDAFCNANHIPLNMCAGG